MDFNQLTIGGVALSILIFGMVEALKSFGLEGNKNRVAALLIGFIIVGVYAADQEGVISEQAMVWVRIFLTALAGGLSAMGFYSFQKNRIESVECDCD